MDDLNNIFEELNKYCRICAKVKNDLKPIFGLISKQSKREKVLSYLPVTVTRNDELPQKICQSCFRKLSIAHGILETAVQSEETLKNLRQQLSIEDDIPSIMAEENIHIVETRQANPTEVIQKKKGRTVEPSGVSLNKRQKVENNVDKEQNNKNISCSAAATTVNYSEVFIVAQKSATNPENDILKLVLVPKDGKDTPVTARVSAALKAHQRKEAAATAQKKQCKLQQVYMCKECTVAYTEKDQFIKHYKKLHPNDIHNCSVCNDTICGSEEMFSKHKEMHKKSNDKVKVINLGDYTPIHSNSSSRFQSQKIIKFIKGHPEIPQHMKSRVLESIQTFVSKDCPYSISKHFEPSKTSEFDCRICFKKHSSKSAILKHLVLCHRPIIDHPTCVHCNKVKLRVYGLDKHIENKHGVGKRLMCKICDEEYEKTGQVQPHMAEICQLFCELCNLYFWNQTLLTEHIYNVHHVSNYHCEVCQRYFKTKSTLINHFFVSHNMENMNVECQICSKTFTNATGLKVHLNLQHTEHEKCVCEMCGTLVDKPKLRSHINSHLYLAKKMKCDHCERFLTLKAWRRHQNRNNVSTSCRKISEKRLQKKAKQETEIVKNDSDNKDVTVTPIKRKRMVKKYECPCCNKILSRQAFKYHQSYHEKFGAHAVPGKSKLCENEPIIIETLDTTDGNIILNIPGIPLSSSKESSPFMSDSANEEIVFVTKKTEAVDAEGNFFCEVEIYNSCE